GWPSDSSRSGRSTLGPGRGVSISDDCPLTSALETLLSIASGRRQRDAHPARQVPRGERRNEMSHAYIETRVPAAMYEDFDDCLEAARRDYAAEHGLDLREVEARYASEQRNVIVITAPECHCQCGSVTGERCAWSGPRAETLVVRWVPPYLRGTAVAAGS